MRRRNKDGMIQRVINKMMALAVRWDDWGELDFWYYDKELRKEPPVTRANYRTAGPSDWAGMASGVNMETAVFEVAEEYRGGDEPAFVLVLTDGGVVVNGDVLVRSLELVSKAPVFWHFACLRRVDGNLLEKLVQQPSQAGSNLAFSLLDDFGSLSDQYLYFRWLEPFARWLAEPGAHGGG
jgi:GT2 family glycosyltransferase